MDKSVLYPTEDGTPQGGPISPVLANMALDGLERILRKTVSTRWPQAAKGKNKQVNLVRYCDDFIMWDLLKSLGNRGQTPGERLPPGTRLGTLARENHDHAH